ncbi:MAG: L,D-transpeptidase Cds6 family protein, partial [Pontibacterium sp.]
GSERLAQQLSQTLRLYDQFGATRAAYERINASVGGVLPKHLSGGLKPLTLAKEQTQIRSRNHQPTAMPKQFTTTTPVTQVKDAGGIARSLYDEALFALENWRSAWSSQDVDRYLSTYDDAFVGAGFTAGDKGRQRWEAQRRERLSKPRFITVEVSNIDVDVRAETEILVSFQQVYRSSHYQDTVNKQLTFAKINEEWKIIKELAND